MEREPDLYPEMPARSTADGEAAELAAIFAGGFIGAIGRAGLAQWLGVAPDRWPWPTFAVNVTACALLGFTVAWLDGRDIGSLRKRAFLATGLCGALSTFSTVMIELVHLREQAGWGLACAYGAASIAGGLAAVLLGQRLGARGRGA